MWLDPGTLVAFPCRVRAFPRLALVLLCSGLASNLALARAETSACHLGRGRVAAHLDALSRASMPLGRGRAWRRSPVGYALGMAWRGVRKSKQNQLKKLDDAIRSVETSRGSIDTRGIPDARVREFRAIRAEALERFESPIEIHWQRIFDRDIE